MLAKHPLLSASDIHTAHRVSDPQKARVVVLLCPVPQRQHGLPNFRGLPDHPLSQPQHTHMQALNGAQYSADEATEHQVTPVKFLLPRSGSFTCNC